MIHFSNSQKRQDLWSHESSHPNQSLPRADAFLQGLSPHISRPEHPLSPLWGAWLDPLACTPVFRQFRIPGIWGHSKWGPGIGPWGWWNMEAPRVGPGGEGHIFCVMFYCTPINYSAPYINTSWGLWQGAGVKLGVRVKQGIIKSLEIYFSKLETSCLHLTKSSGWNWSRLPRKTHVTLSHLCLTATHQAAWWILQMRPASSFGSLSSGGLNQTCLHCAHPALWLPFQSWPKQPLLQVVSMWVSGPPVSFSLLPCPKDPFVSPRSHSLRASFSMKPSSWEEEQCWITGEAAVTSRKEL